MNKFLKEGKEQFYISGNIPWTSIAPVYGQWKAASAKWEAGEISYVKFQVQDKSLKCSVGNGSIAWDKSCYISTSFRDTVGRFMEPLLLPELGCLIANVSLLN